MLRFTLFGFPFSVQPFFLLTAYLIGPREDITASILWVVCVFLGVTAHELGHAFAGRRFGLDPSITLHGFGGMTSWAGKRPLTNGKRILLSASGPAVGITIGVLVALLGPRLAPEAGPTLTRLIHYTIWINLGWGLLNLAPVLPLDGGQIAASAAEALFGHRGRLVAAGISLALTAALALWAIWNAEIWLTILAVVLAVSNLQALTGGRRPPTPDRQPSDAVRAYDLARTMAGEGQDEEALRWLEAALNSGLAEGGMIDADPAWTRLRNDPRFVALRRRLAAPSFRSHRGDE